MAKRIEISAVLIGIAAWIEVTVTLKIAEHFFKHVTSRTWGWTGRAVKTPVTHTRKSEYMHKAEIKNATCAGRDLNPG
ncbi:hypothetical protein [Geoglobus sp.]